MLVVSSRSAPHRAPPPFPTRRSSDLAFTSSESPSTFACSVDGGAFASCTSPATFNGLSEATHTFAVRATDQAGDRKSTRLNSSHLGISYAVFCLKKKKKTP